MSLEPGLHSASPKQSFFNLDDFVYAIAVLCTLGGLWIVRIVITRAVRMANEGK